MLLIAEAVGFEPTNRNLYSIATLAVLCLQPLDHASKKENRQYLVIKLWH